MSKVSMTKRECSLLDIKRPCPKSLQIENIYFLQTDRCCDLGSNKLCLLNKWQRFGQTMPAVNTTETTPSQKA